MKSLYLRVWLTVVAVLALFALGSGWMFQRQIERERVRFESIASERAAAWGDLIQRSLPGADAPAAEQARALLEWAERLRLPLALDDAQGRRIATSPLFAEREADHEADRPPPRRIAVRLDDGRTLWLLRRARAPRPEWAERGGPPDGAPPPRSARAPWFAPPPWAQGTGVLLVLALLFVAVAAGAYPVVRRLTRRLEALKHGVEQFGAGALGQRVDDSGRDEVAAVAASFNRAAERIEALVRANQSLLANASHELRSPLARLKMALAMLDGADGERREHLKREIDTDIAELDALVEEVLLASRLDARSLDVAREPVELRALALEEAARTGADVDDAAPACTVRGDERLLRRALRNLLENARRYGGDDATVTWRVRGDTVEVAVSDRGPGVPEAYRERIFEPFFRLPGHAEREGGVGLGLSLVRQIAQAHGGSVRCEPRAGGGSTFVLSLPAGT
ncbi:sensor histidine kinase [Azohydromonas sediminis]|uniref:sensor histidine kinase n=1 Tax=Azohydromonas sediminis TaxID=2259674 RepID=UPI000E6523AD|nr:ATP-binding protein [Azohydromonas sediminis]